MSGTSSPEAVKKLLENMQSDLRALSLECKKKFPPVKEAAESGIIKVKTIAARNTEILAGNFFVLKNLIIYKNLTNSKSRIFLVKAIRFL
uniref:MON2 homolog, regulator of endosome-to-Golgi trafficking n=1 Tax=Aotus nancymaae TaxID=37293 RepID=A0A2K5C791_AOTNA